jgi:DNA-binding CsgD family transcriptional regulator
MAVDAAAGLATVASLAFPREDAFRWLLAGILYGMIAYGILFTAIRLSGVGEPTLRRALVVLLALSGAFFPLMLADSLMGIVPALSFLGFMNNMAQPLYFMALNCLSIAFGLRYLNRPAFLEKGRLTGYFISRYGVTPREAQIIGLLLDGATVKRIGEALFISPKTAENHVYNVYQKLSVKNRVQLYQLIRANELD